MRTLSARLLLTTLRPARAVPHSSAARHSVRYLASSGRPSTSSRGVDCRIATADTVQVMAAARSRQHAADGHRTCFKHMQGVAHGVASARGAHTRGWTLAPIWHYLASPHWRPSVWSYLHCNRQPIPCDCSKDCTITASLKVGRRQRSFQAATARNDLGAAQRTQLDAAADPQHVIASPPVRQHAEWDGGDQRARAL